MRVDVDDAGRQHEPLRVDALARGADIATHRGETPVLHRHPALVRRAAEPVDEPCVVDGEIVHAQPR